MFDDFDFKMRQKCLKFDLQMKRLDSVWARLDLQKRLEQMEKELYGQKQRIRDIKGKTPLPTNTSDMGESSKIPKS